MADTDVPFLNSTALFISHRPPNLTVKQTVYEACREMPAVLIWYLSLQFVNMLLGVPANLTMLWLIHRNKSDSSTSDVFVFHLAVLDLLFLLSPPLELVDIVFVTSDTTWYVLRFIYGVKDCSPLFLSCICLDRYVAVVHPITFTSLKDRNHRAVLVFLVWLLVLVYASLKCVGNIPNFDKVFTGMILTAFAFMVFCNVAILWALRQSGPGRDTMHPVKKKAFRTVLMILAIIVFDYFPPVALFPFQDDFSPDVFRCYIHYVAFGLMDFSSTIQPMLYLFKEKLTWRLCCCQTQTDTEQNNSESQAVWTIS